MARDSVQADARAAWFSRAAGALALVIAALAVVTVRTVIEGERAMQRSDEAFDRGELRDAIAEARRAAVLYAPGAPHVGAAYERLQAIATGAEAAGQRRIAQQAWQAIRGAALETRHVRIPHAAELERANRQLARLEAEALARRDGADPAESAVAARRMLDRDDAPRARWIGALLAGFALALAGFGLAVFRGVDREGRLALARMLPGLLLALLGVVCWTVAVYRA
jgi:hypothetical protein